MDDIKFHALNQAVIARHQDEPPAATVERAQEFYDFLIAKSGTSER